METFTYEIDSNSYAKLPFEITEEICDELNISITPAQKRKINKQVASNRRAAQEYWKGLEILDSLNAGKRADVNKAITYFKNAIKSDDECASAYAHLAYTYFGIDYEWWSRPIQYIERRYGREIMVCADRAMMCEPESDLSLIAKALFYITVNDCREAARYLEKALDYNPNSYMAKVRLAQIYNCMGEDEKFFELARKVIDEKLSSTDTIIGIGEEAFLIPLAKRYRCAGFFEESLKYLDLALKINEDFRTAINIKSQVLLDLEGENSHLESKNLLEEIHKQDSTWVHPFLGLSYYLLRDYENANRVFQKVLENNGDNLEDYSGFFSGRYAFVLSQMGEHEKAQIQINNYRKFAERARDPGSRSFRLTGYYSFLRDTAKAIEHIQIMSERDHTYSRIHMLKDAPLYDNIRDLPQFQQILSRIQTRWQERHDSIRAVFEEKKWI